MNYLNESTEDDQSITAEEIIASVNSRSSLLGGFLSRGLGQFRRPIIKKTEITGLTPDQNNSSLPKPPGIENQINSKRIPFSFNNLPNSVSKIARSVSTPELQSKFMPSVSSHNKYASHRKIDFASLSCGRNSKENDPFLLNEMENSLSTIREKDPLKSNIYSIPPKFSNVKNINLNTDISFPPNRQNNHGQYTPKKKDTNVHFVSPLPKTPTLNFSFDTNHTVPSPSIQRKPEESDGSIVVNDVKYTKLKTLGKGAFGIVYEVFDMKRRNRRAIKIVQLSEGDTATRDSCRKEIEIMKRLRNSQRVITLYDSEETNTEMKIVVEVGGLDLAEILKHFRKNNRKIHSTDIRYYWLHMLEAVQDIHKEGIIHSDLKPSNFLVDRMVKLIDFGISSSIQQDMTSVLKENVCGTYNYMSPESFNFHQTDPKKDTRAVKIGVKSDVWSLGCILYNMVYGKTPFSHITNLQLKVAAISNPKIVIAFPSISNEDLLDAMKKCLQFNPYKRPSVAELLDHPYIQDG